MPKKCESCRFYVPSFADDEFENGMCNSLSVTDQNDGFPEFVNQARAICDREGDGVFVYFESKGDQ